MSKRDEHIEAIYRSVEQIKQHSPKAQEGAFKKVTQSTLNQGMMSLPALAALFGMSDIELYHLIES